jgi:threonine/homoserine/homoserine lactone efflux protein
MADLLDAALKGLILGFSIAAPVGPIGLLCIRKTLSDGPAAGIACGAGAATADAVYGLVTALGLTAVSGLLIQHQTLLKLVGGAALLWIAVRTLMARPAAKAAEIGARSLLGDYAATFALTLANPATILSFLAVFAGLGIGTGAGAWAAVTLVAGVFAGSLAWWFILAGGVSLARRWATPERMVWINRIAGAGLVLFALWILAGALPR